MFSIFINSSAGSFSEKWPWFIIPPREGKRTLFRRPSLNLEQRFPNYGNYSPIINAPHSAHESSPGNFSKRTAPGLTPGGALW